jgi:hypothetical protein
MKKMIMSMVLAVALFIGGCAVLDQAMIPEEGQIKSKTVAVVDAVTTGLVTTGNPYAVPALAISTILSIVAGAYTTMRKKQEANKERTKAENYKIVAEAVVTAVEKASGYEVPNVGTVSNIIKDKVEKELRDNDAYLLGRAIIEALKEEGK